MTEATATMEVRDLGEASVVDIEGDVTAGSEDVLMRAYDEAGDVRAIILNFTGLTYMNSGGIGLLVTLLVRANRRSQQLLAFGLSDHYRQIFELTRLDEAVGIHDSQDAALAPRGCGERHGARPPHRSRAHPRRGALGVGGLAPRGPGGARGRGRHQRRRAPARRRPSRASGGCGRRPTGSRCRASASRRPTSSPCGRSASRSSGPSTTRSTRR